MTTLNPLLYVYIGISWAAVSLFWLGTGLAQLGTGLAQLGTGLAQLGTGLAFLDGNKSAAVAVSSLIWAAVSSAVGTVMVATLFVAVCWFAWKRRNGGTTGVSPILR